MKTSQLLRLIALPLLLVLLATGIVRLFFLRFGPGDIYPPYSTLRSDPMGAKAFYAALESSGAKPERNLNQIPKIKAPAHTTLFILGISQGDLGWTAKKEVAIFEKFINDGGTLVLAFKPHLATKATPKKTDSEKDPKIADKEPDKKKSKKETEEEKEREEERRRMMVELDKQWDIQFVTGKVTIEEPEKKSDDSTEEKEKKNKIPFPLAQQRTGYSPTLPSTIEWHSALGFKPAPDKWFPVYTVDDRVVVAVRDMGEGRIILVSDSYIFSNESLRSGPQTEFLSWLVGASTSVMFDESHNGIRENPGIASLARRYHLEGLAAGVFILFGLFIWKNSVSFIPKSNSSTSDDVILGRDTFSGLVNLLCQHLPDNRLLEVCLQEWEKSFTHKRKDAAAKLKTARNFLQEHKNTPTVERYRQLRAILSERK